MPTFYEETPDVIFEVISSGLPVSSSDVCDNSIYLWEEINGFLFDSHFPQSIANKLYKSLRLINTSFSFFCKCNGLKAEKTIKKDVYKN